MVAKGPSYGIVFVVFKIRQVIKQARNGNLSKKGLFSIKYVTAHSYLNQEDGEKLSTQIKQEEMLGGKSKYAVPECTKDNLNLETFPKLMVVVSLINFSYFIGSFPTNYCIHTAKMSTLDQIFIFVLGVSHLPLDTSSQIFFGVQVRRIGWPIKHSNAMISKQFGSSYETLQAGARQDLVEK